MSRFILASQSPRRQELIGNILSDYDVIVSDVEETLPDGIAPEEVPVYLAGVKARAVAEEHPEDVVIGADTVVILDGQVLGKPVDAAQAHAMLRALSGKVHHVITGVCLTTTEEQRSLSVTSEVTFKVLSDDEIDYYVDNYRPYDKAGAYGIQEWIGYVGVTGLKGSYFNVMGLPVQRIYQELADMFGTHELIRGGKALP